MINKQETQHLESIDIILSNLKKNPDYYNHGITEQKYLESEQRDD